MLPVEGEQDKDKKGLSSPNTDKDEDQVWADLEAQKPPDIGQGEELKEEPKVEPAAAPTAVDPDIAAIMQKKGYKSPKDLVAALESLESQNTKQRQDLKRLEAISIVGGPPPAATPAMPGPTRQRRTTIPDDPYDLVTNKDKFGNFITNFAADVDDQIQERMDAREIERMRKSVIRKINAEPEEFMRLRPKMIEISRRDPNITDIEDLMAMAKNEAREETNVNITKARKDLGLEGIDLDKLKTLLAKANVPPAISGGSGGGQEEIKSGTTDKKKAEEIIKKAILGSDQLIEDND